MTDPAYPGGSRTSRLWHRAIENGLPMYAGGLVFLGFALVPAWTTETGRPYRAGVTGVSIVIAALYLAIPLVLELPFRIRALWVFLLAAGVAAFIPLLGVGAIYFTPYVMIPLATLLGWRVTRSAIPVLTVALVATALLARDWLAVSIALMGGTFGIWIALAIRQSELREQLVQAEARNAVLAVAAERERIGRDLHDILGHSLTAVAIKAQLAARIAERDPVAAVTEMAEVERLARQALTEVRATASGIREVRLASETASARSVLGAAGIECRVTTAAALTDEASSELLGYVVREAVTNVVRHSGAEWCEIELAEDGVRIHDNGGGLRGQPGNGLRGLRERVEQAGGTLTVTGGQGTTVEARIGGRG
ncbi:histidine kinase [Enemella evansiae]|uniref:sensor histidine kinase n=1 Tax=Enemella evansiae TaxID=2016499 RepID=UPI000B968A41|nr:sensor histidine kinase [Enemella evansiae]OYO04793.1 histidine kinase [Enemella evansiae]OYO08944.1 histidine kinase [Enemella evansiae]